MNTDPNSRDGDPVPAGSAREESTVPEDSQAVELVKRAMAARATELHVDPHNGDVVVRFRIDGRLEHYCYLDRELAGTVLAQFERLADLQPNEKNEVREALLRLPESFADVQARVTITPVSGGEAMMLRLRERASLIRPLDDLGFSAKARSSVEQMLARGSGLLVVAGPTNAGKTTSLYSMLATFDDGEKHLATIEDPIAYRLPSYRQMAVDEAQGVTMSSGLAALLRGDPDVILVGELRDAETAALAVQAAASGKMVLTSVASRDVASALTALAGLVSDRHALAASLAGVTAQRLMRRLCQQCCERIRADVAVREAFGLQGLEAPLDVCRPIGCVRCRGTGYRDQLGVFEVAGPGHPVVDAFGGGAPEDELRTLVHSSDAGSLAADALRRVREGVASFEEAKELIATLPALAPPARPPLQVAAAEKAKPAPPERPGYRVIIFAAPDDPYALREVLVNALAMHPTDAMIRAHAAPGILPDQLTEEEAARWVATIAQSGVHAEAIPAAEVPDFGHTEAVHHARCLDEGLEVIEIHGEEEQLIPWPEVALLSVGQVPQEVSRRYVMQTTTLTAARRTLPPPLDVAMPSGPELWVVCMDPVRGFRVDHKRLNYEYLGDRMTDSSTRNFRVFLEDLAGRAASAYRTPATRAFLDHSSVRHYQFDSSEELRRYTAFHLMMRMRLTRQQSDEGAPRAGPQEEDRGE
jgi:type II secretory ATPase GspE/PulE/Tfp pilus assembly ATPase PilB-like protein